MISLRPLQREDLALLRSWLDEPLVRRWWADDSSAEAVEAQYGPSVDGTDPTRVWVVLEDDAPVGMVQGYRWDDEPEETAAMTAVWSVPASALSVDYLLGSAAARGRGLGPELVTAAVRQLQALYPDARDVVVPVHAENRRSWRALEKAGFVRVAEGELEPDDPSDSRDHVVYRLGL